MRLKSLAVLALPMMLLMGCEGGSSEQSQEAKVSNLVGALNAEGGRFSITKAISLQGGFSVLLDRGSVFMADRHLAIDVSAYNSFSYTGYGYLERMTRDGRVYNNLTSLGGGDYEDSRSGLVFSKVTDESMIDAATAEAMDGAAKALQMAAVLETDYGMSQEASMKAGLILSKINSNSSYDQINEAVKAITGSTLAEMQTAMGNPEAEKAMVAKLSQNGISVASISAIVELMTKI